MGVLTVRREEGHRFPSSAVARTIDLQVSKAVLTDTGLFIRNYDIP